MKGRSKRVLVVGAGMAGLTVARLLAEAGRKVLVLEARDRVGDASAPCATGAKLSNSARNLFMDIHRSFGT